MQKEVLKFQTDDEDYTIYILTNDDINYSWQKFQGRIGAELASSYGCYTSSQKGKWQLFNYTDQKLGDISSLRNAQPVIYETNKYHINIYFNKGIKNPRVLHIRKEVEKWFSIDPLLAKKYGMAKLEGITDFMNEPGVFKLQLEYIKDGRSLSSYITFDVVSPKMDTKEDYKSLLKQVNYEYENIIFKFLSTTYQQFNYGTLKNNQIWFSIFDQIIEKYIQGIQTITRFPHTQLTKKIDFSKAEQIRQWTHGMEELYHENKILKKLEGYFFRHEKYIRKIDSEENRFIKYTLNTIGKQLIIVISSIIQSLQGKEEMSDGYFNKLKLYQESISKLLKSHFFKNIGKFQGTNINSLILQSRHGYVQVYKNWILLRRGIDMFSGKANIGTLQIWEIYEFWCFIKMKYLVQEIMGINEKNHTHLVNEPKGSMLDTFSNNNLEYVLEFRYPEDNPNYGDVVSLHYQHTFNRHRQDDENVHTATTEQRPDIMLNIKKSGNNTPTLTYLYDAKYRVWNDKRLDYNLEQADIDDIALEDSQSITGADYPPSDAINQMHRYRDAIYYGSDLEQNSSKEVIGGYVLFPGRGDRNSIEHRYYQKSMRTVNIGAIPLLPLKDANKEGELLRDHLKEILNKSNIGNHIVNAIPQRGLYYTDDIKADIRKRQKNENVLIYVDLNNDNLIKQWNKIAIGFNIIAEAFNIVNHFSKAKYILVSNQAGKNKTWVKMLYKVIETPEIKDILPQNCLHKHYQDYIPNKSKYKKPDIYLCYCVEIIIDNSIISLIDRDKIENTKVEKEDRHSPRIVTIEEIIK